MSVWTRNNSSYPAENLIYCAFDDSSCNPFLDAQNASPQAKYLNKYLAGLNCKTIVIEPYYFDKDYLSEFSEFYSKNSKGYKNVCKRLHFFSEEVTPELLESALGEDATNYDKLKNAYLGFSVIRPLAHAPIGKTVLKWFEDDQNTTLLRIKSSRKYIVHLSGLEFELIGLAWQQQDTAVGACATVALWSALHSAAFDEDHSIPTTAEITKLAHKTASLGTRVFPTSGLTNFQLLEAIKELNLAPEFKRGENEQGVFSANRFAFICSTYIRSGFPIILGGFQGDAEHAICLTGFREPPSNALSPLAIGLRSSEIKTVYINDDNLGLNVRFAVNVTPADELSTQPYITLKAEAPQNPRYNGNNLPDPTADRPVFIPNRMFIPIPNDIRIPAEALFKRGAEIVKFIEELYNALLTPLVSGFHIGIQYVKISDYSGKVLKNTLSNSPPEVLGKVRLNLIQNIPPMSLYLGVVRVWYQDRPVYDILFDTTDSEYTVLPYAIVSYSSDISLVLTTLEQRRPNFKGLGVRVDAF